jgi:CheY-like chemotaxis protein/signal transduction histidine kinase
MTRSPDRTPHDGGAGDAQRVRLRRVGYALAGGVAVSLLFALLHRYGLTRLDTTGFAAVMAVFWAGNLAFPALIVSGVNQRLSDPGMTLAMMLWATSACFALVYYTLEGWHLLVIVYLLTMMFGTFRLRVGPLLLVTVYALLLYGLGIVALESEDPSRFAAYGAFLEWLVLLTVMVGFALMGGSLSRLRERLEQSNRELARARDVAENASRAQARFLAATSDELRTPLNTILGAADAVDLGRLAPAERSALERANRAGGYLLSMVNSMIDHTRLGTGEITLRHAAMDLGRELAEVAAVMQPLARERGLRLTVDAKAPGHVNGDAMRLKEVLVQLLRNTLRVASGGEVCLAAERDTVDDSQVRFAITAQTVDAPAGQDTEDGLTIGLCRQLVGCMGGALEVDTRPGTACRFRFAATLPAVTADARPREAPSRPRVLLVDDSDDIRLLIRTFLGDAVATLDEAEDGVAGLERFLAGTYDVVLMDMHMPRMDGIETTRAREAERERQGDATRRTRILALTADDSVNDRARSLEAGCDDHLVKPISKSTLLAAVTQPSGDP